MQIYRAKDYQDLSRRAAAILCAQVVLEPDCVLGLATGSTPLGAYRQLVERHSRGEVDFSRVTSVNLDEYCGIDPKDSQSYRYYMQQNLFDHINIRPENTHLPDGLAADPQAECRRYDQIIRSVGGIDLQLLGLGNNGHIGFNEPGDFFEKDTFLVDLAPSTIAANRRFFEREDQVPRQAYTMGIRPIMQARKILIIVSGAGKAEIVRRAFTGAVTPRVPASVLQLHGDVTLLGDAEALSLL